MRENGQSPDNQKNIKLCAMNPARFTLITSFFVGGETSSFPIIGSNRDFSAKEFIIGSVKIIVLWSFMPLPSFHASLLMHGLTINQDIEIHIPPEIYDERVKGYDLEEMMRCFYTMRDHFREEMCSVIKE